MARAEHASQLLFGEDIAQLSADDVCRCLPTCRRPRFRGLNWMGKGLRVVDLLVAASVVPSRSEARRMVQAGGVYVNNRRITDLQARLTLASAIDGRVMVLRKGARQNHVVKIVEAG